MHLLLNNLLNTIFVKGNIIDAAWSHSNRNIAYIERDRSEITVATIAGKVYHDTTLISEVNYFVSRIK